MPSYASARLIAAGVLGDALVSYNALMREREHAGSEALLAWLHELASAAQSAFGVVDAVRYGAVSDDVECTREVSLLLALDGRVLSDALEAEVEARRAQVARAAHDLEVERSAFPTPWDSLYATHEQAHPERVDGCPACGE